MIDFSHRLRRRGLLNGANRVVVGGMPDSYRMPEFRVQLKDQDIADSSAYYAQQTPSTK